ncbi:MAG: hypothetical protein C0483_17335 [Pirellula sp.]|nr:hypothetical protein [Pirellula sp.]
MRHVQRLSGSNARLRVFSCRLPFQSSLCSFVVTLKDPSPLCTRTRALRRTSLRAVLCMVVVVGQIVRDPTTEAATVYWDINGVTPGAGGATPGGTWSTSGLMWNADLNGAGTGSVGWTAGNIAAFAAGTDAAGSYTVDVTGTQSIAGLLFEEGTVTLNGGALSLATATTMDVNGALYAEVNSAMNGTAAFTKVGSGTLALGGTNTFGGSLIINAGAVRFLNIASLGSLTNIQLAAGTMLDFGAGDFTVAAKLTAPTTTTNFTIGGNGTLTFNGEFAMGNSAQVINITNPLNTIINANSTNTATSAARLTTFNVTNAGAIVTMNGAFNNNAGQTGARAFGKAGPGTFIMKGANTYLGGTTVSNGLLRVDAGSNIGTAGTGGLTVSGGEIRLLTGTLAVPNTQTVGFLTMGGSTEAVDYSLVTLSDGTTLKINGGITFSAVGDQKAAKVTGGTVDLGSAVRTFTVGNSANVNSDADLELASTIIGTATGITKTGAGVLKFSGTNSFVGNTIIIAGGLALDFTTSNGLKLPVAGSLEMRGGTLLQVLGNGSANTSVTVAGLALTTAAGSSTISVASGGPGRTATLRLGAIARTALSGTMNFVFDAQSSITTTTANSGGTILGSWATVNGSAFAVTGTGTSEKTITALTSTVRDSLTTWTTGIDVGDSAGYTGSTNSITLNTLRVSAGGSAVVLEPGSTLTLTSSAILAASSIGAAGASITGGTIVTTSGEMYIHQYSTAGTLTISANLPGTSTSGLVKSGPGTLFLTGNNTFSGRFYVQEGTVIVNGTGLSDVGPLTLSDRPGVVVDLNNSREVIGGLEGFGTVVIGTGELIITPNSGTPNYSGVFVGAGGIVKAGTAIEVILGNSPLFTGNVSVTSGELQLTVGGALAAATSFAVGLGSSLLDNQAGDDDIDRIGDTASVSLRGGTFRLVNNNDQSETRREVIGSLALTSGHGTLSIEPIHVNPNTVAQLVARSITRANYSTLLVKGLELGNIAAANRATVLVADGSGVDQPPAGAIGGNGLALSTTISILPYMIGESLLGSDTDYTNNYGNSFLTFAGGSVGLRPLNLQSEYVLDAAGYTASLMSADNLRFTTSATGLAAKTFNSLVIDSSAGAVTLTGAGTLTLNSGALLLTGANNASLGGYSNLASGASELIVYVTNPAAMLTIGSQLSASGPLVKSGLGQLNLGAASNSFTSLYLNQGTVQAAGLAQLGSGDIVFAGGTLIMQAGATANFANRILVSDGGGTLDVGLVDTVINGLRGPSAAQSSLLIKTRSSSTAGLLTITGTSTFAGLTIFETNTLDAGGIVTSIILNGATNAAIAGNLQLGNQASVYNGDVTLALAADEQIADTAVFSFKGASGKNPYFRLDGHTETVAGIVGDSSSVIQNHNLGDAVTAAGTLIVNSSAAYVFSGVLRDVSSTAADPVKLNFAKRGSGTQTLSGAAIYYSGTTTVGGVGDAIGILRLLDTTAFRSSAIVNNAMLQFDLTASNVLTYSGAISGSGKIIKSGSGTLTLSGLNTFTGGTVIDGGTLILDTTGTLGADVSGNSLKINGGTTLRSLGQYAVLGANQSVQVVGTFAKIDVQGTSLTLQGALNGPSTTRFDKDGAGTLSLRGPGIFTGQLQLNAGTLELAHSGALSGVTAGTIATGGALVFNGTATGTAGIFGFTGTGNVLTLGTGAGTVRLGFGIRGAVNDKLTFATGQAFTVASTSVATDIYVNAAPTLTSYTLLQTTNTASFAAFTLGSIFDPGPYIYTLGSTSTSLVLNVQAATSPTVAYWKGDLTGTGAGVWNAAQTGGNTNWATNAAGTTDTQAVPTSTTDVFFAATGAANFATTLGADLTIKSLTFLTGSGSGGSGTTVSGTQTVTIAGIDGITLAAGSGNITVNAGVQLGVAQTWSITDLTASFLLNGSLGGSETLTKAGSGSLALNGTNSFSGKVIVSQGTLQLGSVTPLLYTSAAPAADYLTLAPGTTLLGAANFSLGDAQRGITLGGLGVTVSANAGTTMQIAGSISGNQALAKAGAGTVRLAVANTFQNLDVNAGTLQFDSEDALGLPGIVTIAAGGTLSASSNVTIDDSGRFIILAANGAALGAEAGITAVYNLSVGNSSAIDLLKKGAGTVELAALGNFGNVVLDGGTLKFAVTQSTATKDLIFGSSTASTTAAAFDLSLVNAQFNNFNVQTNTSAANLLTISPGRSLTFTGNVTIGSSLTNTVTTLNAVGGGSVIVNNTATNGLFFVGGATSTSAAGARVIADFSDLSTLNVSLSPTSGIFRVASGGSSTGTTNVSTLVLADTSTVIARSIFVGDGPNGAIHELKLGSVSTTLNTDIFSIGTGLRDVGSVTFKEASGTLTVRAADGVSRTVFNLAAGGGGTGITGLGNLFDVSGHSVDMLLGITRLGYQDRQNALSLAFAWDKGKLDMTSLGVAVRADNAGSTTSGAPLSTNAVVTLGSVNSTASDTVAIVNGILDLGSTAGVKTTALNPIENIYAELNLGGGTITIGATSGTSIKMATAGSGPTFQHTTTAVINITGGSTTLSGNIIRGGGTGISSAMVNLAGGELNMSGASIGTVTNTIDFQAKSGRLSNLGELNGGGSLAKTSAGTLVLAGTNGYTGGTQVNAGQLVLAAGSALNKTTNAINVSTGATLSGEGTVAGTITLAAESASGAGDGGVLSAGTNSDSARHGIGTLSVTNASATALTLGAGSTLVFEFSHAYESASPLTTSAAGTDWDYLNVTGTLRLDGPIYLDVFSMSDESNYGQNVGSAGTVFDPTNSVTTSHRWLLAHAGGVSLTAGGVISDYFIIDSTGVFGGANYSPVGSGSFWVSQSGNDLYLNYASVPEPSSLALLSFAAAIGFYRHRRRKSRRTTAEAASECETR